MTTLPDGSGSATASLGVAQSKYAPVPKSMSAMAPGMQPDQPQGQGPQGKGWSPNGLQRSNSMKDVNMNMHMNMNRNFMPGAFPNTMQGHPGIAGNAMRGQSPGRPVHVQPGMQHNLMQPGIRGGSMSGQFQPGLMQQQNMMQHNLMMQQRQQQLQQQNIMGNQMPNMGQMGMARGPNHMNAGHSVWPQHGCGGLSQGEGVGRMGMGQPNVAQHGLLHTMGHGAKPPFPHKSQPPPPPPPRPPVEESPRPQVSETKAPTSGVDFGVRLAELRRQYTYLDLEIPPDVRTWSLQELETYFKSGGAVRPMSKPLDAEMSLPAGTSLKRAASTESEYSVSEALAIQKRLHEEFSARSFQDSLKVLFQQYPERKTKGHCDGPAYFDAFQELTLSVHARIMPTLGLEADWNGVREMMSRMTEAMRHPKVKKSQEEINVLMGLPRDATFTPKKEDELFLYRPNGDAPVTTYVRPLVTDADGDEGHEFFVEDLETGELKIRGPSALGADSWYLVVHKPAVVIRARPDVKSEMVGRRKAGKTIHVQSLLDGRWLQLHHSELVKFGVTEAWVLLDGAEMGNGQMLQKVAGATLA